jgi:hypothetical protein
VIAGSAATHFERGAQTHETNDFFKNMNGSIQG